MKQRMCSILVAAGGLLLRPLSVLASEDGPSLDARLEGYKETVKLPDASTALTWMLLVALAVLCIAVIFKNAKRTHMD